MRKFLVFLLALFPSFALADGAPVQYQGVGPYGQVVGDQVVLSNTATNATFDFGFEAERVRICFVSSSSSGDTVWMRFGHTIASNGSGATSTADITTAGTDTTGMTIVATSDTLFQDGFTHTVSPDGALHVEPGALPLTPTYQGNAGADDNLRTPACSEYAFKTRGLIFHAAAASTAILDVWAFSKRPKLRNN